MTSRRTNWFWTFAIMAALWALFSTHAWAARFAVVIGHNLGTADEDPLRFAERDAERFAKILTEIGQVPERNLWLLIGPTSHQVEQTLRQLETALQVKDAQDQQSTVILYFAGHGDAESLHLAQESYSRDQLLNRLKALPCRLKLAIIDSCQTSRVESARGIRPGPSFDVGVLSPNAFEGVVVIQSTQKGEPAHESDTLGGAVFTHYWLSALLGAADLDRDGRVTLLEAYGFAFRNTVSRSLGSSADIQRPTFDIDLAGSGELVLTEFTKASAMLVLPPQEQTRYLIFLQPSGTLLAEVIASIDQPISLAVPAGRLLVQSRAPGQFQVAEVELSFGGRYQLQSSEFSEKSYEQVARRGGAIELHPISLELEYAMRLDRLPGAWIDRLGPRLRLQGGLGQLFWVVALGYGYTDYQKPPVFTVENSIECIGRFGWWLAAGPSRLEFSIGPELSLIGQSRHRRNEDRLSTAGVEWAATTNSTSLSAGGGVELAYRLPLGNRMHMTFCARGSLLALKVREDQSSFWRAVPVLGASIGFGYHL